MATTLATCTHAIEGQGNAPGFPAKNALSHECLAGLLKSVPAGARQQVVRPPWTSRTLRNGFVALLLANASCAQSPGDRSSAVFRNASVQNDDVRCAADPKRSRDVPVELVDLGQVAMSNAQQEHVLYGHERKVAVTDSAAWPQAWRSAIDTAPPPPIAFGSDAILFATTRLYTTGPTTLTIEGVRQCIQSRVVIVATLEVHNGTEDSGSRGLVVARIPRRVLDSVRVSFVSVTSR